MTSPGHPYGDDLERDLEPLLADDHSVWTYSDGYYRSPDHEGVACKDAAAVAFHAGGPDGCVRQYHGKDPQ